MSTIPKLRTTMAGLIEQVRRMIDDPPASNSMFADEDIQYALDQHKRRARYLVLNPIKTISAGGTVTYKQFRADYPYWEGGEQLLDGTYATITPSFSDPFEGYWEFSTEPTRPVMIVGVYYDLYGAAADLCERWAAHVKACVDMRDPALSLQLSQKFAHLKQLADIYRAQQYVRTIRMVRGDT